MNLFQHSVDVGRIRLLPRLSVLSSYLPTELLSSFQLPSFRLPSFRLPSFRQGLPPVEGFFSAALGGILMNLFQHSVDVGRIRLFPRLFCLCPYLPTELLSSLLVPSFRQGHFHLAPCHR